MYLLMMFSTFFEGLGRIALSISFFPASTATDLPASKAVLSTSLPMFFAV